jgi:hypothetical protein
MTTAENRRVARAATLLRAYRDRQVTLSEAAVVVETRRLFADDAVNAALGELFAVGVHRAPDPAVVELVVSVLSDPPSRPVRDALLALALRRPVLATIVRRAEQGQDVPLAILRPGCRVMLGTPSGRVALRALVDGDTAPARRWLERNIVDNTDAFAATTLDVPLGDLAGLGELVDQLIRETELLPPGRARAKVADEWVNEVMTDPLEDDVPYTEIVRVVGERLLESDAPALLWHAARQLSFVAEGDRRVAERVLERCLPLGRLEDGRSPSAAAAPFLTVLPPARAAAVLERLAPRLDADGWDAVTRVFLAGAFRAQWSDWQPHVTRWRRGTDAGLADAVQAALALARRAA